jgi:hypothetical protein
MKRFAMVLLVVLSSARILFGGEALSVPQTMAEIEDEVMRYALLDYSPNYDNLSQSERITAFRNIYKAVHDGAEPVFAAVPDDGTVATAVPQAQEQYAVDASSDTPDRNARVGKAVGNFLLNSLFGSMVGTAGNIEANNRMRNNIRQRRR